MALRYLLFLIEVNNLDNNSHIGEIVYSKSGRDSNRNFIVIGILNEEYVYIVDGSLRTIDKPKKKKIKHLVFSGRVSEELRELVLSGQNISNSMVKSFLQSEDTNKEV